MSLAAVTPALPDHFAAWFAGRGWQPHAHQLAMVEAAAGRMGKASGEFEELLAQRREW